MGNQIAGIQAQRLASGTINSNTNVIFDSVLVSSAGF